MRVSYPPQAAPGWGIGTDFTSLNLREEFMSHSRSLTLNLGDLGWNLSLFQTGATSGVDGIYPHLGILNITSGATGSSTVTMALNVSGVTLGFGELGANAGWNAAWVFRLNQTSNTKFFIGFSNHSSNFSSSNMIKLRYDVDLSDTNFMFVCRSGGVETAISSGIPVDTNWHTLRISSLRPGEIIFQLDNGPITVITTNVPTGALNALMMFGNSAAGTVTMDWDAFAFSVQGLNRGI
jgi:hypothetical protein